MKAGIHHGYLPVLRLAIVNLHGILSHVKGNVRIVQEIVGKVFLNQVLLIACQNNKFLKAVGRIIFHDMP